MLSCYDVAAAARAATCSCWADASSCFLPFPADATTGYYLAERMQADNMLNFYYWLQQQVQPCAPAELLLPAPPALPYKHHFKVLSY